MAEKHRVFLAANSLGKRWRGRAFDASRLFVIAELGFGTGLNFLSCLRHWQRRSKPGQWLHYLAVEKSPLNTTQLRQIHDRWPLLSDLSIELLKHWPTSPVGIHRLQFIHHRTALTLFFADARQAVRQMCSDKAVDSWFLDGFAPDRNPELWTPSLLQSIALHSDSQTTLGSYSVAGSFKASLRDNHFSYRLKRGYGNKRQLLCARLSAMPRTNCVENRQTVPAVASGSSRQIKKAIVIGAGLAGCHSAFALASQGIRVKVIEACKEPGQAASGQPRAVLFPWFAGRDSDADQFATSSYLFAARYYRELLATKQIDAADIGLCGMLHIAHNQRLKSRFLRLALQYRYCPQLLQAVSAETGSDLSGIEQHSNGIYFPAAGWLHAGRLCRALLAASNIQLLPTTRAVSFKRCRGEWRVQTGNDKTIAAAPALIVATGDAAGDVPGIDSDRLSTQFGQSSWLQQCPETAGLRCVLSYSGFLCPADPRGYHLLGATHQNRPPPPGFDDLQNLENLQKLQAAVPVLQNIPPSSLTTAKSGIRCYSHDGLPLIGELHSGLYVSLGHGGRGVCSTALAGQLLTDVICGQPLPVAPQLLRAVSPHRLKSTQ